METGKKMLPIFQAILIKGGGEPQEELFRCALQQILWAQVVFYLLTPQDRRTPVAIMPISGLGTAGSLTPTSP